MILLSNYKNKNHQIIYLFSIIFIIFLFISIVFFPTYLSLSFSFDFIFKKSNQILSLNNNNHHIFQYSIFNISKNLTFSWNKVYHHNGIAYDYYSQYDIKQFKIQNQWNIWPIQNKTNHISFNKDIQISPYIISKLPFIKQIYLTTDLSFIERHENFKKAFFNQGISIESIEWRIKWNYTTCNSQSNHQYIYQRLNLKDKLLTNDQRRKCALAMKHVDIWYEMAEKNVKLGLILEDDAIFVPFFKEKFTRMIYAAINKRILRLNGTCVIDKDKPISNDEWINQNPMIVIGTCFHFHGQHFQSHLINASPTFSTHKSSASRCTHAYLLTLCSAQALIDQIHRQKNDFFPSDFMINNLFRLSGTLQSFWMDPPLAYQGNQVIDLDKIETFKKQTYK